MSAAVEEFTEEDPGRGDPEAMDELIWQLRRDQTSLETGHTVVRRSADTIRQQWSGKAGDAAAATHDALLSSIESKFGALERAVSACNNYQRAHHAVKEAAAPWVTQLTEARNALGPANAALTGAKGAPGMDELIASATRDKTAALEEEAEALSHLRTLHEARLEARATFRNSITEVTQDKHGSGIQARAIYDPSPNGPARQMQGPNDKDMKAIRDLVGQANDSVWKMAAAWVTGKGPREFEWNEEDAFTQVFKRSASAQQAMVDIQNDLLSAKPKGRGGYTARSQDLPRDLVTILNGGDVGNLPEAFIGSFDYTYRVTKINADGTANVTIHAWNYSTIESATRIPGTGDWPFGPYYLGPYASMKFIQDVMGGYKSIRQDITWSATVKMPK